MKDLINLVGREIIIRGDCGLNVRRVFRRGYVVQSRIRFGSPEHEVVLESRNRERVNMTLWVPQRALIPRTPKNEKLLEKHLHGRDNARTPKLENETNE